VVTINRLGYRIFSCMQASKRMKNCPDPEVGLLKKIEPRLK
jgi:hypothetical protein